MRKELEPQLRALQIISGAMILGVLVITGVMIFLMQRSAQQPEAPDKSMQLIAYVAAAVAMGNFFMSFVLAPILSRAPAGADLGTRLNRLRSGILVRLALNEGGALFGAVAIFLTHSIFPAGIAVGIGLLGLAFSFPRREQFDAIATEMEEPR